MNKKSNDGGAAFPQTAIEVDACGNHTGFNNVEGMTLWDYFAAHAPIALALLPTNPDQVAVASSNYADAMIIERQKRFPK